MASEGPNSGGTFSNDSAVGVYSWGSAGNAANSDDAYALASTPPFSSGDSNYLKVTNFGFSIPSGATIDGIEVGVEKTGSGSGAANVVDNIVKLVKGGSVVGDDKSDGTTQWNNGYTYVDYTATYGGSSDLWGESWTDSDINSSDFGMVISAALTGISGGGVIARIDHVKITVYYTEPAGGGQCSSQSIGVRLGL